MYEVFEHTADIGIRVQAQNLNDLFAEAGRALFSVIVRELAEVRMVECVKLRIAGKQLEYLLVDWLGELLFVFESQGLLLREFLVQVDGKGLEAAAWGEQFHESQHQLEHEVKAVNYHGLRFERIDNGWFAEVILDL